MAYDLEVQDLFNDLVLELLIKSRSLNIDIKTVKEIFQQKYPGDYSFINNNLDIISDVPFFYRIRIKFTNHEDLILWTLQWL